MKNKVVIISKNDIAFSGIVIGNSFTDSGVLFQPSEKSGITFWFPTMEIKKVIFGDASSVEPSEINHLYEKLEEYNQKYNLE